MSEGKFNNMTPNIPGNNRRNKKDIDESSDTWDTIEWLLKNVKNNNGKVGQWGISYPGFYTAASLPDAHPALVASSPQAPISDFFFDDKAVFEYTSDPMKPVPFRSTIQPVPFTPRRFMTDDQRHASEEEEA